VITEWVLAVLASALTTYVHRVGDTPCGVPR
jgi:hypothetical protein